jgi:1-acyl-sn-glycerol-3-phosphate acyltransferase
MIKFLCRLIFRLSGWTLNNKMPGNINKCVMIAAPHTSNWDLVYALAAYDMMGIPMRFTLKDEFMKFPLKLIFKPIGAIAIDRRPKVVGGARRSMTEAMTDLFNGRDHLNIMVTPEGTRALNNKWKTGFYYVALNAKVPIGLGYLDYKNKVAGVGGMVYPSGDIKKDMKIIMDFYKDIKGQHPEKFSIDAEYI